MGMEDYSEEMGKKSLKADLKMERKNWNLNSILKMDKAISGILSMEFIRVMES